MTWWTTALIVYGTTFFIFDILILILSCNNFEEDLDSILNPIVIYETIEVNIFGCIIATIFAHLILPWVAPFYWFYKLCTVGRR